MHNTQVARQSNLGSLIRTTGHAFMLDGSVGYVYIHECAGHRSALVKRLWAGDDSTSGWWNVSYVKYVETYIIDENVGRPVKLWSRQVMFLTAVR